MNFALIIDGCVQRSYYVKDKKSYKFGTDEPYSHHHSIGNECHLGLWGWPFVFDGCFLNWTEFDELPTLDLDLIIVAIEKRFEYNVDMLRKKYPNAIIMSFVKEAYWTNFTMQQRVDFFKACDYITFPWKSEYQTSDGTLSIKTLTDACGKVVHYVPQPNDINFLYDRYYNSHRSMQILDYKSPGHPGQDSKTFTEYISEKYQIPMIKHMVKYQGPKHKQWEEFLAGISDSLYCFNLDSKSGGSMQVQCAALGILSVGGEMDSSKLLFPKLATNDLEKLEEAFLNVHNNEEQRNEVMRTAFDKANEHYSHESVHQRILSIIN